VPAVRFRAFGVPVEIRASFLVLAAVLGLQRHTDSLLLPWLIVATAAVLAHEIGHVAAFRSFGVAPSVILHGGGGQTSGDDPGVHRRIVLAMSGPLAGLLLGVVVVLAARFLPATPTTQAFIADVLFATLGWSLLNLLPIGGLDGHTMLQSIVKVTLGHPAATEVRIVEACTIIAVVVGAIAVGNYEAAFIVGFVAIMTSTPLARTPVLGSRGPAAMSSGEMLISGRTREALEGADAALARNPDDTDALFHRATALRLMTRYEEAEAAYSELLERKPDWSVARSGRAMVRSAMGKQDEARADTDALEVAPMEGTGGEVSRVIALYVSQRYEEADSVIGAALARDDLDRTARGQLSGMQALLSEALGRPELGLQQVDMAIGDRPDDFVLHEVRALVLIGLGRPQDAEKSARRALGAMPRNPELLETMGVAERFAGHADAALPRLLAAAVDRPELPRARAELSACFTQLGRFGEARGALESRSETARRDPFALYADACLLGATGNRVEAAERLAEAVRIRPGLGRRATADPVLAWMREDPDAASSLPARPTQARASP
jgi:tetratricopeptide (TPR) repeat protein/Zn-dependent protease